jgi:colicin import membrane protein
MPRLKVFRAHLGFHDTVVATTSQKSALALWGARPSEFAHGFAAETQDPQAVEAALKQPGVVLRRPYGSKGAFKLAPDAPAVPKPDKRAAAAAAKKRREKAQAEARARKQEARRRAKAAKAELAELAAEEKALAARKRALRRKLEGSR